MIASPEISPEIRRRAKTERPARSAVAVISPSWSRTYDSSYDYLHTQYNVHGGTVKRKPNAQIGHRILARATPNSSTRHVDTHTRAMIGRELELANGSSYVHATALNPKHASCSSAARQVRRATRAPNKICRLLRGCRQLSGAQPS